MKEIFPHIVINEEIQFGKPIIGGTRITVEVIMGHLAAGMAVEEVMEQYNLKKEQVLAYRLLTK